MNTPLGFYEYIEDGAEVISYRSKGMEAMVIFVSFVCLTVGIFFMYSFFISESGGIFGGEVQYLKEKP